MAFRFDERALSIMKGEIHANLAGWGSYPLFLSFFYKIFEALGLLDYRLQILFWLYQFFGLWVGWLAYRVLQLWGVKKSTALLSVALLILLNPLQIYINSMNISESLFQLSVTFALALLVGAFNLSPWRRWILFFVMLAMAVLARNIVLPFVLFLPILLFFFLPQGRAGLKEKSFWMGAVVFATLIFGAGRLNSHFDAHGDTSLSSNRGANIAQTWCEAPVIDFKTKENAFWFSPPDFWKLPRTKSLYLEKDFGDTAYYTELALRCLQQDPSLVLMRFRSLLNVFDGPLYPDPLKTKHQAFVEIYGYIYLWSFLTILLSLPLWWPLPATRVFAFFIAGCFAAVYAGNIGEARFVYSLLPALAVLWAFAWQKLEGKRTIICFVGAVLTGLSALVPPLPQLMENRDQRRFFSQTVEQRREFIEKRLSELPPHIPGNADEVCAETLDTFLPQSKVCLQSEGQCPEPLIRGIFSEFTALQKKSWDEVQLFCRNLVLLRLAQDKVVTVPTYLVQKPTPLPDGLNSLKHPIEAIAGQLLHAELLTRSQSEGFLPAGESLDLLLFTLMKYQHRFELNRNDHKGAVVEFLGKGDTSDRAAIIYKETLKRILSTLP